MKKFIGSFIALIVGCAVLFGNDYGKFRPMELTVIARAESIGRHSSSPVLVVKDSTGYAFDIHTSYATSVLHPPGTKVTFNLRPMDVRQTGWQNIFFFFLPVLLLSSGLVGVLFTGIPLLYKRFMT